MFIPTNANSTDFYRLINGGLNLNGYDNLDVFFEKEFQFYFKDAQWKSLFGVADESITGTYTQIVGKNRTPVMAAYVAYDADGPKISNEGFQIKSNDMPRMKLSTGFNEKNLIDQQRLLARGAKPEYEKVFKSFLADTTDLLVGIQSQLSFTAYQVESTGKFISSASSGGGIRSLQYDFGVPVANKKNCGGYGSKGVKKAWSDATANPIGDLQDMVQYAEDNNIPTANLVFRMNKATWNTFVNHPEVKKILVIKSTKGTINESNLLNLPLSKAEVSQILDTLDLPPIEIVNWKASHKWLDPATQEMVQVTMPAFADNTVLLRQAGNVGEVQWMAPKTVYRDAANPVFLTENGMIGVREFNDIKANSVEFTAEFTGIPVPYDVTSMLYLDISQAAS